MDRISIKGPASRQSRPSIRERRLSFFLLGMLVLIALVIFSVQLRYDPAQWRAQPTDTRGDIPLASGSVDTASAEVEGLSPMSPPELYDAATLSDKIDGKAELYLSAGVKSLKTRRFALAADPARWLERFVYDMGSYRNAFAVFSRQRRGQSQSLGLTRDSYQSANGIFLVQGPYYLEIIGSDRSEMLLDRMAALAGAFVKDHPAAEAAQDERNLFPEEGRVADSITLTPANAFGFDRFDHVFTATYQWNGHTATVFLSRRASGAEAAELAKAYANFLITYGGRRVDLPEGAPPMQIIEILDLYEIIFSRDRFLAGVHEADDPAQGAALAKRLYNQLGEDGRGR